MGKKGPSALCTAKTLIEKNTVIAYACRTGTSNISLTFSSIYNNITCDCVIDTDKRMKSNTDEIISNCNNKAELFRFFAKSIIAMDEDHITTFNMLNNLNVHHVTE